MNKQFILLLFITTFSSTLSSYDIESNKIHVKQENYTLKGGGVKGGVKAGVQAIQSISQHCSKGPTTSSCPEKEKIACPREGRQRDIEDRIFNLINKERKSYQLSQLKRVKTIDDRFEKLKECWVGNYYTMGENCHGFYDHDPDIDVAEKAVNAWMASTEGHKESILDPQYKRTGIGVYYDTQMGKKPGYYFFTQIFLN